MNVGAYGVQEVWTPKTILFALFGIRIVRAINRNHDFNIAVIGVPPWRSLKGSDFHNKKCYELEIKQ